MRRFLLERVEDESGISGTGWIAEGIQFTNGIVVLSWRVVNGKPHAIGEFNSTAVYYSLERCREIHFGLAGGGYGPYWGCDECGWFHKEQEIDP